MEENENAHVEYRYGTYWYCLYEGKEKRQRKIREDELQNQTQPKDWEK
jgi:hypothetical protein